MPLFRIDVPKQFLQLNGARSLFQKAVLRSFDLSSASVPIVVTSEQHLWLLNAQLDEIGVKAQVIVEPEPKNTAPAITHAALLSDDHDSLVVIPSDHHIEDEKKLAKSMRRGASIAAGGDCIITLGVLPATPHSGYGYISAGELSLDGDSREVTEFVEKPNEDVARQLIKRGNVYWNAGIFVCRADYLLSQMECFQKEVTSCCRQSLLRGSREENNLVRLSSEVFAACPAISIDHGLIEKASAVRVIPIDVPWSDLGSWNSLWEHLPKDENGNNLRHQVVTAGTHDSLIWGHGDKLTVVTGVDDLVVIDSEDALLISPRQPNPHSSEIAGFVQSERPELLANVSDVKRPWGRFRILASGFGYQTKLLHVAPGAQISLQKHHHRSENWTVLKGRAEVTLNDCVLYLEVGESIQIPAKSLHRVRNPEESPLEILEAQFGEYLGEDDIVRYSDTYGRV